MKQKKSQTEQKTRLKKKTEKIIKFKVIISRHITLIVWGVPWGRKIAPSSSLWAGGSFWDPAPGHPHQKGLSRLPHPDNNNVNMNGDIKY